MESIQKLLGAYLIGVAIVVAVYFVIGPLLPDAHDQGDVWFVLDILMATALPAALYANLQRKLSAGRLDTGDGVTRRYLEANAAFYAAAAITLLFLYNWFKFLVLDPPSDNHPYSLVWIALDVMFPLVMGATGCAMLRGSAGE